MEAKQIATPTVRKPTPIGSRVMTLHGSGTVDSVEHYSRVNGGTDRYCVLLDKSPFCYEVASYWPHECHLLEGETGEIQRSLPAYKAYPNRDWDDQLECTPKRMLAILRGESALAKAGIT
jgi:hypothetical protein